MKNSRFINFLGGKDLIFGLIAFILIGILIFVFDKVSYVFAPFVTIITTIIGPIILAFIMFYLLNPLINFMEKYGIKRLWAIIILIVSIISLISLVIALVFPIIENQFLSFVNNFPNYVDYLVHQFDKLGHNSFIEPYIQDIQVWFNDNFAKLQQEFTSYLTDLPSKFKSIFDTVVNVAVVIFTFPFVLFFLLKDGAKFKRYFIRLLPPKYRHEMHEILNKMDVQVGSYIQGQIFVAFCIGALLFIGYLIIGMDYALFLAITAALTSVVPYLGPIIAISPAIVIALVNSPWMLLKLGIVWMAVQFLEGHFISPNVMGRTMQIHPLTIIFVLLCAGNLAGILGVILGIPTYALLRVIVSHLFLHFQKRYNKFYADEAGPYEIEEDDNLQM